MNKVDRILWNDDECIDEVVLSDVKMVHVEQMNDRCWWIGIYIDEDHSWSGNFVADSRGRMKFVEQENEGIEWDDERTHRHV